MFGYSTSAPTTPVLAIVGVLLFTLVLVGILALGRKRDPVTARLGAMWYAQVAVAASAALALGGVATIIKGIVGYINGDWAYFSFSAISSAISDTPGYPTIEQANPALDQMRQGDLIWGVIFLVAGIALVYVHLMFTRGLPGFFEGPPAWVAWGTPVVTIVYFGVWGLVAAISVVGNVASNVITNPSSHGGQPAMFGEALGVALAFVPAWAFLAMRLFQAIRAQEPAAADA